MNKFCLIMVILSSLLPGLSACAVSETEEVAETAVPAITASTAEATTVLPTAAAEILPTATVEMPEPTPCNAELGRVFSSPEGNYCFVYPEDYCWLPGQDALTNTFVSMASEDAEANRCPDEPLILHGNVVWVSIDVSSANGQSLDDVRANMAEAIENFDLEVEEVMLAGETAVQINNMPGQNISRQITAVHKDQLYQLTVVPAAADRLYEQVLDSFQFLP